jgi:calcium-dependent protein kinase
MAQSCSVFVGGHGYKYCVWCALKYISNLRATITNPFTLPLLSHCNIHHHLATMTNRTKIEAMHDDTVIQIQPGDFIQHHVVAGDAMKSVCASYSIGNCIGIGGYGVVYSCTEKLTGAVRALKVMAKREPVVELPAVSATAGTGTSSVKLAAESLPMCKETREFYYTKMAYHPNCVAAHVCYEDSQKVYMVLDNYQGGDLLGAISSKLGFLSETSAALLLNSTLMTINHCHCQQGIAHMDLKLENIMFPTESYRMEDAKLIDWGLSRPIQCDANGAVIPMTPIVGSVQYMAPQVLQGYYDPRKSDIWSIGVMAFMMLAGCSPFEGETDLTIISEIMHHDARNLFTSDPTIWQQVSEQAKAFVISLMAFEEEQRPTAAQALQHPWLQETRARAALVMDTRFQQRAAYRHAVQSVFEDLVLHSADAKSCIWKEVTSALLVSQYGVTGSLREIIDDCFRALDSNLDGVLAKDSLLHGLERFFPAGLQASGIDSIWANLLGSSGKVKSDHLTYTDFMKAASTEYLLRDDYRLAFAFSVLSQGSTLITHHSLCRALNQHPGQVNVERLVTTMMRQAGTRDGISFPEFVILVQPKRGIIASNLNTNVNHCHVVPKKVARDDSFPECWLAHASFAWPCFPANGNAKKYEPCPWSADMVANVSTVSPTKKARHDTWPDSDLNSHDSATEVSGWSLQHMESKEHSEERHCISPFLYI